MLQSYNLFLNYANWLLFNSLAPLLYLKNPIGETHISFISKFSHSPQLLRFRFHFLQFSQWVLNISCVILHTYSIQACGVSFAFTKGKRCQESERYISHVLIFLSLTSLTSSRCLCTSVFSQ